MDRVIIKYSTAMNSLPRQTQFFGTHNLFLAHIVHGHPLQLKTILIRQNLYFINKKTAFRLLRVELDIIQQWNACLIL